MTGLLNQRRRFRTQMLGLGLLACLGLTGCQVVTGSQTLPSPYYLKDDVQYHAPGTEFKLAKEAAAQKAFNQEQMQRAARR